MHYSQNLTRYLRHAASKAEKALTLEKMDRDRRQAMCIMLNQVGTPIGLRRKEADRPLGLLS